MTKIVDVIGSKKHPLYIWLSEKHGFKPKWNFHKVLIDDNGNFVDSFSSLTKPSSPKFINIIEKEIEG
jgi:glutathione peroxidase